MRPVIGIPPTPRVNPRVSPRLPDPEASRETLGVDGGRNRTLTAPAEGQVLRIILGGPIPTGASIAFWRIVGAYLYLDYWVCWGGEDGVQSVEQITLSKKSPADLGLVLGTTYNVYLGTPTNGGVADPIIAVAEPGETSCHPGIVRVTMRLDRTHVVASQVDPLEFECVVKGTKTIDPRVDLVTRGFSTNLAQNIGQIWTSEITGVGAPQSVIGWGIGDAGNHGWNEALTDCDGVIASQPSAPTLAPTWTTVLDTNMSPLSHTGVFQWVYTWVVNGVESPASPASTSYTVDLTTGYRRLELTIQNGPAGTTSKKIYRNRYGSLTPRLLEKEITDNTTTLYVCRVPDASLQQTEPPPVRDIKRYGCSVVMQEQQPFSRWLETFRGAGGMTFPYNDGVYKAIVGKDIAASGIVFDDTNISGEIVIEPKLTVEIPTEIIVHYLDRDNGFRQASVKKEHPHLSQPPTEADRVEKRTAEYWYLLISTTDQATRRCIELFNLGILDERFLWRSNMKGLEPLPGARVTIGSAKQGIPPIEVIMTNTSPSGRLGWSLAAEIRDPAAFSLTLQTSSNPIAPNLADPFLAPPVPDSLTLTEITTTDSAGHPHRKVQVDWTPPAGYPFYRTTQIVVNDGSTIYVLGETPTGPLYFEGRKGVLATVEARTRNQAGILSSTPKTATITPTGAPAPLAVTGLVINLTRRLRTDHGLIVTDDLLLTPSWDIPSDPWIEQFRIRGMSTTVQATRNSATWASMASSELVVALDSRMTPNKISTIMEVVAGALKTVYYQNGEIKEVIAGVQPQYSRVIVRAENFEDTIGAEAQADLDPIFLQTVGEVDNWLNSLQVVPSADVEGALLFIGIIPSAGSGDKYTYRKIADISYAIPGGAFLEYDVQSWALNPGGVCDGGLELDFADATNGRSVPLTDQNGLRNHSGNHTGYSKGRWYHRKVSLAAVAGKTIDYVSAAEESDAAGTFRTWYRKIVITNGSSILFTIWDGGEIVPNLGTDAYSSAGASGYLLGGFAHSIQQDPVDTSTNLLYGATFVNMGVAESATVGGLFVKSFLGASPTAVFRQKAFQTSSLLELQKDDGTVVARHALDGSLATKEADRVAPWIEPEVTASGVTTVNSTTSVFLTPDLIFTPPINCRAQVTAFFDAEMTTTGSIFVGELFVNGIPEAEQAIYGPKTANERGTVGQVWNMTLTGGNSYTFRLAGRLATGTGVFSLAGPHTKFSIFALGRI